MNQQLYPALVAILTAGRAYGFTDPYILPENPVGPLPNTPPDAPTSSSADAIVGADGALSDGVPMAKVFRHIVATTREITLTCTSSIFVVCKDLRIDLAGFQSVPCGQLCKRYTFLSPLGNAS